MWLYPLLLLAIGLEVAATSLLPRTDGFRHLGWTLGCLAGYAAAIWLLAVVVRQLPVSVAYAVWAGLGTASVAAVGMLVLGEPASPVRIGAIALIVVGVVTLNLQGSH